MTYLDSAQVTSKQNLIFFSRFFVNRNKWNAMQPVSSWPVWIDRASLLSDLRCWASTRTFATCLVDRVTTRPQLPVLTQQCCLHLRQPTTVHWRSRRWLLSSYCSSSCLCCPRSREHLEFARRRRSDAPADHYTQKWRNIPENVYSSINIFT